jgi:phospholipid/cholesterol/gamma-HCH transport system ATP-binding protein
MIEFRGLKKSFSGKVILDGVDLTMARGEIHFVIGTSGAGKSVLLKHLVGLLEPDQGTVLVDGVDVTRFTEKQFYPIRKKCALVFQHATLFDSISCVENVALPLRKHFNLAAEDARARARALLDEVEMGAFADALPARLGDGLRKRVAVARALTLSPDYVLFDEPTTSLDPLSARRVDRLISTLAAERGVGCLVVSHDLASIFSIAQRVTMLYKGRVRASGTPEELKVLADPVVSQFIGGEPEGPLETT